MSQTKADPIGLITQEVILETIVQGAMVVRVPGGPAFRDFQLPKIPVPRNSTFLRWTLSISALLDATGALAPGGFNIAPWIAWEDVNLGAWLVIPGAGVGDLGFLDNPDPIYAREEEAVVTLPNDFWLSSDPRHVRAFLRVTNNYGGGQDATVLASYVARILYGTTTPGGRIVDDTTITPPP